MSLVDGPDRLADRARQSRGDRRWWWAAARLSGPLFRFIAAANLRELFTATALMLVIGIALLMSLVGLSPRSGRSGRRRAGQLPLSA
jgi:hypothetical protein